MRRIGWQTMVAVLLLAGLAGGCGGHGEKGKNKDYDRPKPTEKK